MQWPSSCTHAQQTQIGMIACAHNRSCSLDSLQILRCRWWTKSA
nr:MAG TPA: hypothetical protein [Caudoviricetes sp.]